MNTAVDVVDLDIEAQEEDNMVFSPVLNDSEFQYHQKILDESVSNFKGKLVSVL